MVMYKRYTSIGKKVYRKRGSLYIKSKHGADKKYIRIGKMI